MGTTSTNMGLSLPTLQGDDGTWDDQINASLALIDLHDHSSGKGVKVTPSGLNISNDLTFAGNAATNLKAAVFAAQVSYTTNLSLRVRTSDNELIFRNATGTDIQVTSGTGLNLSLIGGIAGDYAAASASLYYDDAAEAYRFLEAAPMPNSWSYVKAGGVDVYQHGSGVTTYVGLRGPGGLAASYNLTFPASLPGSTLLRQVSSAGVETFSNTIANAVTMSSTLGVTGLITATAGVTAAANQHVTVSGTGEYKHGDRIRTYNGMACVFDLGWTRTGQSLTSTGTNPAWLMMAFDAGERVKSITFALFGDASADLGIDVKTFSAAGALASVGLVTVSNQPAAWSDTTLDITDTTLTSTSAIFVRFDPSAAGLFIGDIRVTYDRP